MGFAPRIAERCLEALCPPTRFRNDVIGDLAEEFLERSDIDGPLAARLWYYRQALATAPHLIAHAASHATVGTWLRAAAYGFGAMVACRLAIYAALTVAVMSLGVVPDSLGMVFDAWRDLTEAYPLAAELLRGIPWLTGAVAGYLIGRRHREAPLAVVGASAIASAIMAVAFLVTSPGGRPLVIRFAFLDNLAVWMVSTLAGGASAALAHSGYEDALIQRS